MDDAQSLRAAYALGPDRFCIAIHEMQPDDPFSIVLLFDGSLDQPWGRVDVRRNVVDLAPPSHPGGRGCAGVSDEGDVYDFDTTVAAPVATKIPGAGVYSEDADGSGPIIGLATLAGRLHAFGTSGQFYHRSDNGTWQRLPVEAETVAHRGKISGIAQADDSSALMVGTIEPGFWEPPEEIEREQLEAAKAGDLERFEILSRQAEEWAAKAGLAGVNTGFSAIKGKAGWSRIDIGTQAELMDVLWDRNWFWAVGSSGTVLKVDTAGKVENLTAEADRFHNLTGITGLNGKIVLSSDSALYEWSGSGLISFEPALPVEVSVTAQPIRVQGVADTLFVFDAKHGVYRLSDTRWEHIAIPSELLEREFRGLRQLSP